MAILIAMIGLPVNIYYSVKRPEVILFLCLILFFTHLGHKLANIVFAVYCITTLCSIIFAKQRHIKFDLILVLWSIITILSLLTIYRWSAWGRAGLGMLHFIAMPVIIYISIVKKIISDAGVERLHKVYVPFVIGYSLIQVLFFLIFQANVSAININTFHSSGFGLSWGVANTLAAIMVLFGTILISQLMVLKDVFLTRTLKIIMIILALVLVVIILSRGAILSFLIAGMFFYIFKGVAAKDYNVKKSFGILLGAILVINIFAYKYLYALMERIKNVKVDASSFSRLYMIRDCIITMKDNLIIGAGPNQYRYSEFYRYLEDPHNIFLRFGVDFGTISAFLIAFIIFYPLYRLIVLCYKNVTGANYIYTLFFLPYLVAVINSQVEAAITRYQYGMLFWIIYALMYRHIEEVSSLKVKTLETMGSS